MKCIIPADKKSKLQQLLDAMMEVPKKGAFARALKIFQEVTGLSQACFPIPSQQAWNQLLSLVRTLVETGREWAKVAFDVVTFDIDWAPEFAAEEPELVLVRVPATTQRS